MERETLGPLEAELRPPASEHISGLSELNVEDSENRSSATCETTADNSCPVENKNSPEGMEGQLPTSTTEKESDQSEAISKVLVVDDEPAIIELLIVILNEEGFEAVAADNGKEAIEIAESQNIDVVLMDIKMPGISGTEALEKIKSINPDIEVIMISGYASVDSAVTSLKFGAFDFLRKPFTLFEVLAIIRRAVEKKKLRMENVRLAQKLKERVIELEALKKEDSP